MNNKNLNEHGEEKPSILFMVIKQIILFLLPGIKLLKINRQLSRVQKFYKHEWFLKQKLRNLIVSLVVSLPFLLSLSLSSIVLIKDKDFSRELNYAKNSITKFEISRTTEHLGKAFGNAETIKRFSIAGESLLLGTIISFILGTVVIISHPLIKDTKKLTEMLKKNGIIEKNDHSRLVLATPLGFLIDVTGNTAKELKDNERIWMALNIRVTDWAEDPDQRAIVFFKKSYQLKPRYDFKAKVN